MPLFLYDYATFLRCLIPLTSLFRSSKFSEIMSEQAATTNSAQMDEQDEVMTAALKILETVQDRQLVAQVQKLQSELSGKDSEISRLLHMNEMLSRENQSLRHRLSSIAAFVQDIPPLPNHSSNPVASPLSVQPSLPRYSSDPVASPLSIRPPLPNHSSNTVASPPLVRQTTTLQENRAHKRQRIQDESDSDTNSIEVDWTAYISQSELLSADRVPVKVRHRVNQVIRRVHFDWKTQTKVWNCVVQIKDKKKSVWSLEGENAACQRCVQCRMPCIRMIPNFISGANQLVLLPLPAALQAEASSQDEEYWLLDASSHDIALPDKF